MWRWLEVKRSHWSGDGGPQGEGGPQASHQPLHMSQGQGQVGHSSEEENDKVKFTYNNNF